MREAHAAQPLHGQLLARFAFAARERAVRSLATRRFDAAAFSSS
jgi:hypothetical protein